jgi:hypothetical protein
MINLPMPPDGSGAAARWFKRVLQCIEARTIRPGPGYRVKEGTGGMILEINPGTGGPGGIPYKGDFDATQSYKKNDIVRSRNAPYALGLFICVKDNPVVAGICIPPTFPEPADSGGTNYWDLWSLGVKQYTACRGGTGKTTYINLLEV